MDDNRPIDSHVGQVAGRIATLILGTLFVLLILRTFMTGDIRALFLILLPTLLVIWSFFARDAWWILLPLTLSTGGMFYFGFKIYAHEIGLALCVLPLLLTVAIRKGGTHRPRPLPKSVLLLTVYLTAHMGVSLYLAMINDLGGLGSILRVYVRGLWPLVFALAFFPFGSTRYLKHAMLVMFFGALFRTALGTVGYFSPRLLYVPVINFVLPGIYTAGVELRDSALFLFQICICLGILAGKRRYRIANAIVAGISALGVVLGGGRVSLGMLCGIPLFLGFMRRKLMMLATAGLVFLGVAVALNANPHWVSNLPFSARRTLSIFLQESPYHSIHGAVQSSNIWHYELMKIGARRWVRDPVAFLVGNRLLPIEEGASVQAATFYQRMRYAANLGYYESGLWTVLAVLGLTGGILYAFVFFSLLRPIPMKVWREGITDYAHGFYFLALLQLALWLVFAWIAGHFPSEALFMAIIARAAYEDEASGSARQDAPAPVTNKPNET